jgi:hypothetical protein
MRRLVLAALLCSVALPAQAGPVVGLVGWVTGGAAAGGFGAITSIFGISLGTTGGLIVGAALRIGASLALSALSQSLSRPRPQAGPPPADRLRNYAQERAPMERVYGRVRKGGPIGFTGFRTAVFQLGAGGSLTAVSRATRYNVILLAAHSVEGLVEWYLDERPTEVNAVGEIATAPMAGYGALRFKNGAWGQPADSVLVASFPEITGAYDFAGLAYALVEARRAEGEVFTDVYPQGIEWNVAPVIDGDNQVYDPRDNTRKYSNNAALIIAREAEHWGRAVDWAEVAVEANVCDELVTNGDGGTQRRWTINTVVSDASSWEEVRDALGAACDAWFYQRPDGAMGFKVGRWIAPTVTLTDRDLLDLAAADSDWGPDVPGEFVVNYVEPSRLWREAPSGAIVVEANDRRHQEEIYTIDSHNQACRIAKVLSRRLRPGFTLRGTVKLVGYDLIGQRFVRITSAAHGRTFDIEITRLERGPDGISFSFEGRTAGASDYTFDAATEEPERPINDAVASDDAVVPLAGLAGAVVTGTGGVAQIEWTWTAPADGSLRQELQIRETAPGSTDWVSIAIGAGASSYVATGLIDGATYAGRIRNRTASGRVSDWTAEVSVVAVANSTPPAALTAFSATAGAAQADLTFTAPNDPVYYATRIFRGPTTDFADASAVHTEFGAAGLADAWSDGPLTAGTYSYWAEAINASGIAGPRSGPQTIIIS